MSDNARERLEQAISGAATLDQVTVDLILAAVYSETVAGATLEEMSKAMGHIRKDKVAPTYSAMGECIWQIRYDVATAEAEKYDRLTKPPDQ